MSKRPEEETASARYWREREDEALKHYITDEQEYQRRLTRIYSNMLDGVQNEINAFYGRYASKEGITIAEARRRVSQADIAAYERKAERYVAERDFSPQANEEMRLYNLMMKVNRLEMLKANIGLELIAGHDELETFMEEILRGRTEEELARQAGILGKTVLNNAKRADAIVNASFQNATFSDRIWMYQDMLRADLSTLLQSGLIQGKNPRELAKKLEQRFNVSASNAERLMRTELARVQTEAQKQSFKRNGFDMYEFICNHHPTKHGTCDICKGLNGKHFKVEDMMPGENAPPMHPNCRCSTAAWEDSEEYEAWLDYLEQGGTTVEWNATGRKMWEKQREVLEKSANASTMKSRDMSNVATNRKRNEQPLTQDEITAAIKAAYAQGYDGEVIYSEYSNTSFHGSTEGDAFHYLVVGRDAYPASKNGGTANERATLNACMAHEVVGHYETWRKGTIHADVILDEAQASIRASKFGVDLTDDERETLWQDAMDRLDGAGIAFDDVKDNMDIWER